MNAQGVAVRLGNANVLRGVDLELAAGTLTLLAGRNGAGKSTLLLVLAGLRAPDRGSITIGGRELRSMPSRERARLVTLIPQESDSPFEFTGRELVMMGRHPHIPRLQAPSRADHEAVDRALHSVDAVAFCDRPITTLSGGEARRIAIARALATDAAVLLADEPTANLDLEHALAILALLRGLAAQGRTVLIASHDLNLTAPRAQRVALLHEGRIRHVAAPEEALGDALVAEVFGVRSLAPSGFFPRAFEPR